MTYDQIEITHKKRGHLVTFIGKWTSIEQVKSHARKTINPHTWKVKTVQVKAYSAGTELKKFNFRIK
jgi:hypothetical protein